ncbi:MAG: HDOD domain-containing protein [Terriglobia bacterium]
MTESTSLLDRIAHLVERETFTLPVLDEAGLKLQAMVSKGDCDLRQVEPLIMRDQALSTEVLRMANSAFFGGLCEINTISKAVLRMGLQQLTKIVFMVSERYKYQAHDPSLRTMVQAIWCHASSSALTADWLAHRLNYSEREEALIAGLLHNIGELVLIRALDEFRTSQDPNFALSAELVEEVLTSAHTELGFNFLKQRRIPEVYCRLARDHHQETCDPRDTIMAIIRLSDVAVRKFGLSLRPDPSIVLVNSPEAAYLGVDEIMLAELEVMLEDCELSPCTSS